MKKVILLAAFAAVLAGTAAAQDGNLHGTLDVSYVSRYIWRGFDLFPNNDGAILPSVDLDLWGTGFGLNVLYSQPLEGGHENDKWLPFTLYYKNALWQQELFQTNYKIGWTYYNFVDNPAHLKDLQEAFAAFSWPNAMCGVVPSYTIIRMWSASSGSAASAVGNGWLHVLGLAYDVPMSSIWPELGPQPLHFTAETVYNDGVGKLPAPRTPQVIADHDWSHAVFGVSTDFQLSPEMTFTPGFYYQSSWDDSVNSSDEYWTRLSLSYRF